MSAREYWKLDKNEDIKKVNGKGKVIAIIDTGLKKNHKAFDGKNIVHRNFIEVGNCDDTTDLDTIQYHGTKCAAIAAGSYFANCTDKEGVPARKDIFPGGVAPEADLIICRVSNREDPKPFIKALKWIANYEDEETGRHVDVVSLSFRFPQEISDKDQEEMEKEIDNLNHRGTLCVAAAGNDGKREENPIGFPAIFGKVICVGAHNRHGIAADFTAQGNNIHAMAPGVNVWAPACSNNPKYERMKAMEICDGTSYASPAIAGLICLLQQYKDENNVQGRKLTNYSNMKNILKKLSQSRGHYDQKEGYGPILPLTITEIKHTIETC